MRSFSVGSEVSWNWGEGIAQGVVKEVYKEKVARVIKGSEVTRNASGENPAYLVEQSDGDKVLKSHSELEAN